MPKYFWYPLWIVCLPITISLYVIGYYPIILMALSIGATAIYLLVAANFTNYFNGADFWYVAAIMLFFVQNPISGNVLMPISFAIMFITAIVLCGMAMWIPPIKRALLKKDLPGFPFMVTITLALILTVVTA